MLNKIEYKTEIQDYLTQIKLYESENYFIILKNKGKRNQKWLINQRWPTSSFLGGNVEQMPILPFLSSSQTPWENWHILAGGRDLSAPGNFQNGKTTPRC